MTSVDVALCEYENCEPVELYWTVMAYWVLVAVAVTTLLVVVAEFSIVVKERYETMTLSDVMFSAGSVPAVLFKTPVLPEVVPRAYCTFCQGRRAPTRLKTSHP